MNRKEAILTLNEDEGYFIISLQKEEKVGLTILIRRYKNEL